MYDYLILLYGCLFWFASLNSSITSWSFAPFRMDAKTSMRLSFFIKHGLSFPSLVARKRVQCMQNSVFSMGWTTSTFTFGKW